MQYSQHHKKHHHSRNLHSPNAVRHWRALRRKCIYEERAVNATVLTESRGGPVPEEPAKDSEDEGGYAKCPGEGVEEEGKSKGKRAAEEQSEE